jgi:hypothetical protein
VRCTTGGGAGGGGGAVLVVEREKQPEVSVAAARTIPRDVNFIMPVPLTEGLALRAANRILQRRPREVFMPPSQEARLACGSFQISRRPTLATLSRAP